jgi:hypothetical protein
MISTLRRRPGASACPDTLGFRPFGVFFAPLSEAKGNLPDATPLMCPPIQPGVAATEAPNPPPPLQLN